MSELSVPIKRNLRKFIWPVICGVLVVAVSVLAYLFYEANQIIDRRGNRINELTSINIELSSKAESLETSLDSEKSDKEAALIYSKYMGGLASFFAEKTDEINALLVKNSDNSTSMVKWFLNNCTFYEDNIDLAGYKYLDWEKKDKEITNEYKQMSSEITDKISEINSFLY